MFVSVSRPSLVRKCHGRMISSFMRAWQSFDYDNPIVMNEGVKIPVIRSPDEVLIEVSAASVNPIDLKLKEGYGRTYLNLMRRFDEKERIFSPKSEFPITVGRDCSGVIVDVGGNVTKFRPGDEVFCAPAPHTNGTLADYVVTSEAHVAKKPLNCSHVQAASVAYVGLTVWAALSTVARLNSSNTKGKRVLIHGGSGGIGSFAVQLMKAWGAEVTTTCSTDSIDFVKSLKADHIVDYRADDYEDRLLEFSPYDVILDPLGSPSIVQSSKYLGLWRGAVYVSLASPVLLDGDSYGFPLGLVKSAATLAATASMHLAYGRLFSWAFFRPNGSALEEIRQLIEEEQIRPVVEKVYDFTEVPEAWEKVKQLHGRGKTVISVKSV